ncbi:hypothetical protein RKD18_000436 [Streptomyces phaeoluteigriseus]
MLPQVLRNKIKISTHSDAPPTKITRHETHNSTLSETVNSFRCAGDPRAVGTYPLW